MVVAQAREETTMARRPKVCIDRVLPQEVFRPQRTIRMRGGADRAVLEFRKLWVNGSRLHVRFLAGTAAQKNLVKQQAAWWTEHANLQFVFDDRPDAEIRIAFDPADGAWSWVGTDCRKIPQNEPTMNLGFLDGGTAAHEFGHAIGLGHEHQNPRGGIQWNEAVVLRDLQGPPNSWTPEQISHNVLEKYAADQIRGTEFDPDSIMLYFFPPRWTTDGKGTKANDVLSAMDAAFIASEQAYPPTAAKAVTLQVDAPAVAASIGTPGEEDLFTFRVRRAGRHAIATAGSTDVVMKLFGPDQQTRLVAEDDDSGIGANARILTDLGPGQYWAQVRHYHRARGTGAYRIRVRAG
jgi:hypothetical protein